MTSPPSAYALPSVGGSDACRANIADGHATIGAMLNTSSRPRRPRQNLPAAERPLARRAAPTSEASPASASRLPGAEQRPGVHIAAVQHRQDLRSDGGERSKTNVERLAVLRNGGAGRARRRRARRRRARWRRSRRRRRRRALAARDARLLGVPDVHRVWLLPDVRGRHECFYTQGLDLLEDNDDFCQNWGIAPTDIQASIDATNQYYGAGRPNATRILYPNGDVDPWHGLSILTSPSPELPVMMVSGASHHAWTHPTLPTDQPSVIAARAAIRKQVEAWLALPIKSSFTARVLHTCTGTSSPTHRPPSSPPPRSPPLTSHAAAATMARTRRYFYAGGANFEQSLDVYFPDSDGRAGPARALVGSAWCGHMRMIYRGSDRVNRELPLQVARAGATCVCVRHRGAFPPLPGNVLGYITFFLLMLIVKGSHAAWEFALGGAAPTTLHLLVAAQMVASPSMRSASSVRWLPCRTPWPSPDIRCRRRRRGRRPRAGGTRRRARRTRRWWTTARHAGSSTTAIRTSLGVR